MVLSYKTIKKLLSKNILIENANNQNIHASSYDVTVDKYILKFKKNKNPISFIDAQELNNMYEEVNIISHVECLSHYRGTDNTDSGYEVPPS